MLQPNAYTHAQIGAYTLATPRNTWEYRKHKQIHTHMLTDAYAFCSECELAYIHTHKEYSNMYNQNAKITKEWC